jgi:methanogenic corrinoid protein MtbC1
MDQNDIAEIGELIADLDDEAIELVKECLEAGLDPVSILKDGVVKGLEKIGQLFESKDYFLAELMVGGELAETCIKIIDPHLPVTADGSSQGRCGDRCSIRGLARYRLRSCCQTIGTRRF